MASFLERRRWLGRGKTHNALLVERLQYAESARVVRESPALVTRPTIPDRVGRIVFNIDPQPAKQSELEVGPVPADPYSLCIHLLLIYADVSRPQEAERSFREAIKILEWSSKKFPNTLPSHSALLADTHGVLAMLLVANGRPAEAEKAYQRLLELAPQSAVAHNNLAWLLATCPDSKIRDPKRAVDLAKKAIELEPKQGMRWNTLGVAHYRASDWKAAIAALEKSMDLRKGGDSFDWFFLAMAHWQLDHKEEARKWYDQAVRWMEKNAPQDEELRASAPKPRNC